MSDCFLTNKKDLDKQLPTLNSVELLAKALNPCSYAKCVLRTPTLWVEAQELLRIFTNLQLAHKAILFNFYWLWLCIHAFPSSSCWQERNCTFYTACWPHPTLKAAPHSCVRNWDKTSEYCHIPANILPPFISLIQTPLKLSRQRGRQALFYKHLFV